MKPRHLPLHNKIHGLLAALICLCASSLAHAQAPELGGLVPSGGLRGQTTKVRISGRNLGEAQLHLSGSGVAVRSVQVSPSGEQLTAEIATDQNALLGPHEVRITTPRGVSNGARFWVDVYPNYVLEQQIGRAHV